MADALTPNYGLTKPDVGASDNTWGEKLNANFDILDSAVFNNVGPPGPQGPPGPTGGISVDYANANYVNVIGDTMTGTLQIHDISSFANGVGGQLAFSFNNAIGTSRVGARISTRATVGADGAEEADFIVRTLRSGSMTDALWVKGDGKATLGNSGSTLRSQFTVYGLGQTAANINTDPGQLLGGTIECMDSGSAIGNGGGILFSYSNLFTSFAAIKGYAQGADFGDLIFSTRTPSAGTLTERMRISSAGHVGIGLSAPSTHRLHVRDSVSANYITRLENLHATSPYVLSLYHSGVADSISGYYLICQDNGGNKFQINGQGNVVSTGKIRSSAGLVGGNSATSSGDMVEAYQSSPADVTYGFYQGGVRQWRMGMSSGNGDLKIVNGSNLASNIVLSLSGANITTFHNTTAATAYNAASVVLAGGLGVAGAIISNNTVQAANYIAAGAAFYAPGASGYRLGIPASSYLALYNSGNYTFFGAPTGSGAVLIGNTTDPSNYYDNTSHVFRNTLGVGYANFNSTGATIYRASGGAATFAINRTDAHGAATIAAFNMVGRNSTPADFVYAQISCYVSDATAASEDATLGVETAVAGTRATRLQIAQGIYHPSATGGDKGNNTLNFGAVYDDNVLLTDYVFDKFLGIEKRYTDRVAERHTALDYSMFSLENYIAHWRTTQQLYGMPSIDDCIDGAVKEHSLGAISQMLWQTAELQAIHIATLHDRIAALEKRLH